MNPQAALALHHLLHPDMGIPVLGAGFLDGVLNGVLNGVLEESAGDAAFDRLLEECQTSELLRFVRLGQAELARRRDATPPPQVRITRDYRIFVGEKELHVRPMAKTVLLLFLNHPEGVPIKHMADHKAELLRYYGRVCRSGDPEAIAQRVEKLLDLCRNDVHVHIARASAALSALAPPSEAAAYTIAGRAGRAKRIPLERSLILWEVTPPPAHAQAGRESPPSAPCPTDTGQGRGCPGPPPRRGGCPS